MRRSLSNSWFLGLITALCGCAGSPSAAPDHASAPTSQGSQQVEAQPPGTSLVAVLPMREGFGPGDHDAYEAQIAPITADHGMMLRSVFTLTSAVGGSADVAGATLGLWSLESPNSLREIMGDPRYQAHIPRRDEVHNMPSAMMYMASEEFSGAPVVEGHVVLVGLLVMKPGFGVDDHAAYESAIDPITARHGMRLIQSYRVLQPMSEAIPNAAIIKLWDLPNPEALMTIMSDPEYRAHVSERDRVHDMASSRMYFAAPRPQ